MSELQHKIFPVTGMSCASCAVSVESMLQSVEGVQEAGVNYANMTANVVYDEHRVTTEALQKAVQSIGYDLIIDEDNSAEKQEQIQSEHYRQAKLYTIASAILTLPVFIIGMFLMDMPYGTWISMLLTLPVLTWFGRMFFVNAWKQAAHGRANMDTLVALSTGIAFLFSVFNTVYPGYWLSRNLEPHVYYESVAVIITFISLGRLLEERARFNTSAAIKKLMGLQPKTVLVLRNNEEQAIPVTRVAVGDTVIVRPGDKIPVDGEVISGSSYVDESMITGEPVAVAKQEKSKVMAGTINQNGSFRMQAQQVGADTFLSHIIRQVQEAQASKAPVQKLVDKIAGIFVPVVIGIAIVTFVVWMLVGGGNAFTHALLTSVTVLVIACPCALGLATPTAIMVGVGIGAEHNILIKDAESLEIARKVDVLVLDKTGTITEGKPAIQHITWNVPEAEQEEFKRILYSLEAHSTHPLAEAVCRTLDTDQPLVTFNTYENITARGVKATFNGDTYTAGNLELMHEQAVKINAETAGEASAWQNKANSLVYFARNRQLIAILIIADKIKDTSRKAIAQLQQEGIRVVMLTGDNEQTARAVAAEVGISEFEAGLLPSAKAEWIKRQQEAGNTVAMAGDGINDSTALALADISIAMGKGSDIAMDVAKITLLTSDLQAIPKAFKLSQKTVATIRQNLFWAFIYNLIGIPLAAGVLYAWNGFLLNPMIAGAAMALSSVSVVTNSLLLRTVKLSS
ncbi:copper-translocating P-type ATPase [Pedobacter sp. BS3]|uniref:heavy metal translocating P-type ATPase n=1 Tax=Pedobacter sp. BS3 TaxID=2567937 RepID=UPI0011ED27A4|nr:heavy metal translocating P-type ATPase [Pedobacter sp. BS3]TZF84631.1 copper-translocating P-type ATPase [Pedobacter sp. BS3]